MRTGDLEGITHVRIVSVEEETAKCEDERFRDLWESNARDYLPPPFRSLPIRIWALLKCGSWTSPELAKRLDSSPGAIRGCILSLRKRGQRIVNISARYHDLCRYQLLPGPPLKIVESPRGLTLLSLNGRIRAGEVMIELR